MPPNFVHAKYTSTAFTVFNTPCIRKILKCKLLYLNVVVAIVQGTAVTLTILNISKQDLLLDYIYNMALALNFYATIKKTFIGK